MQDYGYSIIGFIAIAVQMIINYRVMFVPENSIGRKAGRAYRMLMMASNAIKYTPMGGKVQFKVDDHCAFCKCL